MVIGLDRPGSRDGERLGKTAQLEDEILAIPRSHWVDEEDATHGDQYYRSATLGGSVELLPDLHQVADHLRALVGRYQPEGRYADVSVDHSGYASYLRRLTVVRVRTETITGEFKLAQRTEPMARDRIVEGLRARGSPLDQRTADLIEGAAHAVATTPLASNREPSV